MTSRGVVPCPACHGTEDPDPLACLVCGGRGRVLSDPRQLVLPLAAAVSAGGGGTAILRHAGRRLPGLVTR